VHFYPWTSEQVAAKEKPKGSKAFYKGAPMLTGHFIDE
jgi:hypothetical protein